MKDLLTLFVVASAIAALLVVFFGELLIGLLRPVKKLRAARVECGKWILSQTAQGRVVEEICEMRLEEVGKPPNAHASEELRHLRFGDIAVIVHHKEKHLHHSTKEVRFYAGVFILFLIGGALMKAESAEGPLHLIRLLAENHLVPIVEIVMIVLWGIRLGSEIRSIDSLFDH